MSINDNRIIDIVAFVEPNYLQSVSNCKISGAARAIEIEKQIVMEWFNSKIKMSNETLKKRSHFVI